MTHARVKSIESIMNLPEVPRMLCEYLNTKDLPSSSISYFRRDTDQCSKIVEGRDNRYYVGIHNDLRLYSYEIEETYD